MRRIGGEVAHVLQVDDHAEAREHGGHDDGDQAGAIHVDTGVTRHVHILTHRAHVLTQLRAAEPHDEQAGQRDDDQRQHGDLHAAHIDGQRVVHALPHLQQADGVADTVAAGQLQRVVDDGDDGSHHIQHDQLVHTGHTVGDKVAGDHLAALGAVQDAAAHKAQQDGQGDGQDGCQHQTGDTPDLPVRHQDQRDLAGHGAQRHGEVQTHTGHNGDQQAQDQEGVAPQAGHSLVDDVVHRQAGHGNEHGADEDEQDGHRVFAQELLHVECLGFHVSAPFPSFWSGRRGSCRWTPRYG